MAVWPSVKKMYVGLCSRVAVSLICWALWPCGRRPDMLGFDAVWPSGLCGRAA